MLIILQIFLFIYIYIKISKDSSTKYFQKSKEKIQKQFLQRYQSLSDEEKSKKGEYSRERYKNLSENDNKNELGIK